MNMELLDKNGLAYFWGKIKSYVAGLLSSKADDSGVVHLAGDESVTGTKTFVGSKKVAFKQSTANDKLGFTLFNNSNVEKGYLEYNPTNQISGVPLMTLGNYATAAAGLAYVGFRKYSNISGAAGAYNLLTPLISDAKAPFNLTTTYTNFFLTLGVTDGTTTFTTASSGLLDLSSFNAATAVNANVATKARGIFFVIPNETTQTATLTATVTGITEYFDGLTIAYRAPFNTAASSTLNINSLGAKPIYYKVNTTSKDYYPANVLILLVYETTTLSTGCWKMVYSYDSNTNNATAQNISTSNNTYPILIGYTANATANIGNKATYFCKDVKLNPSTGVITANGFSGLVAWSNVTNTPTTISGYGIADAGISSGTITLGSNTITPLTEDSVKFASSASRSADIAANGTFTVPSYTVGKQQLLVYLDGCLSRQGDGWDEVGTAGTASTTIKFNQLIPMDMEIVVRVN